MRTRILAALAVALLAGSAQAQVNMGAIQYTPPPTAVFTGGAVTTAILGPAADNCTAPPFSFTGQTTSGLCSPVAGTVAVRIGGVNAALVMAGTLAMRNGVSPTNIYANNTYTDASNYERISLGFDTNVAYLRTQNAGTGTARNITIDAAGGIIRLAVAGANRWLVTDTAISPNASDARDVGSTSATVKELYLSRSTQGSDPVTLTEGSATAGSQLAVPQTAGANYADANYQWVVYASDGTDSQTLKGSTYLTAVNKAGTETCTVGAVGTPINSVSAGTLTCTITCTTGLADVVQLAFNCTSSLVQTTLTARVRPDMMQVNALSPQ